MGATLQTIDYTAPQTVMREFITPNGTFYMAWSETDFQYLPTLMAKIEEWVRKAGYPNVTIRPVSDDPFAPIHFEWSENTDQ